MKLQTLKVSIATLLIFTVVDATPTGPNCTSEYLSLLEDALAKKEHCNIQGFYDCCEAQTAAELVHLHSSASGVYDIKNVCSNDETSETPVQPPMQVRCDMDNEGGGWIVILRRIKNVYTNVNFTRSWDEYENGFGDLNTEFWLGLRNIHCLTTRDDVDLVIDLRKKDGNGMTWTYRKFKVDGSSEKYKLHIGEAEGPANGNDAMAFHDQMKFTTYDEDNDLNKKNCARYKGGWWFKSCYRSFLTGPHIVNDDINLWERIAWQNGNPSIVQKNFDYYDNVDMKIRPKTCNNECNN